MIYGTENASYSTLFGQIWVCKEAAQGLFTLSSNY